MGPGKGSFPDGYLLVPGTRRMQEGAVPGRPPGHCMSPRRRYVFLAPFLTALGVFAVLHVYVAFRLFVAPALPAALAVGGCVLLALLVVLVPVGFFFSRRDRGWPSHVFPPLAIGWLGASGVLLTVIVVTDLGRLLYALFHGWPDAVAAAHQARLQAVVVALGTALLVPFAMWTARGRLVLSRVRVPLEKLAPGVAGLRIVQISDLHVGARLGEAFVRRVVDRVNALRPDVVAITGDLVDGPVDVVEQALKPLTRLDLQPYRAGVAAADRFAAQQNAALPKNLA